MQKHRRSIEAWEMCWETAATIHEPWCWWRDIPRGSSAGRTIQRKALGPAFGWRSSSPGTPNLFSDSEPHRGWPKGWNLGDLNCKAANARVGDQIPWDADSGAVIYLGIFGRARCSQFQPRTEFIVPTRCCLRQWLLIGLFSKRTNELDGRTGSTPGLSHGHNNAVK